MTIVDGAVLGETCALEREKKEIKCMTNNCRPRCNRGKMDKQLSSTANSVAVYIFHFTDR